MKLITGSILNSIVPNLKPDRAEFLADRMDTACWGYRVRTKNQLQELVATMAHESSGFRIKEENLRYIHPEQVRNTWPSRFTLTGEPGKKDARQFVKCPEKLANEVYMRSELGNVHPGDGWAFRGSGFIQLTGRYSAEAYGKYIGNADPLEVMELLRTDDYWAMDAAAWEYAIDKKLLPAAERNDFKLVTKRINGGYIGMTDRQMYYSRCLKYLV